MFYRKKWLSKMEKPLLCAFKSNMPRRYFSPTWFRFYNGDSKFPKLLLIGLPPFPLMLSFSKYNSCQVWPSNRFQTRSYLLLWPLSLWGDLHGRIKSRHTHSCFAVTATDWHHAACCCKALLWNLLPPSEESGRYSLTVIWSNMFLFISFHANAAFWDWQLSFCFS